MALQLELTMTARQQLQRLERLRDTSVDVRKLEGILIQISGLKQHIAKMDAEREQRMIAKMAAEHEQRMRHHAMPRG